MAKIHYKRNYKEPAGEVLSSSDLLSYKHNDRVIFTCDICKNKSVKYVWSLLNKKKFICYKCNHQSYTTYKGKLHIKYQNEPILIDKNTDIQQFDNKQRLKFYCIECGSLCEVRQTCIVHKPKETQCMCKTCKTKYTKQKVYGDSNYNNRDKAEETCLNNYGVIHPMQIREFQKKCGRKIKFDGKLFDSGWEIAYYIFLRDTKTNFIYHPKDIIYYYDNNHKKRRYYPDFKINDRFVEIKNETLIDRMSDEKKQCFKDNNVLLLTRKDLQYIFQYVRFIYGNNYIKSLKEHPQGLLVAPFITK